MRCLIPVVGALAACGAEASEPLVGDLAFAIDGEPIVPTTGAAIRDSNEMKELVVIGTRDVSCNTTLGTPLRKGTYLTILIDRKPMMLGTPVAAPVSFVRVESSGTLIDGSPAGMVTLDMVDSRVTGSLMFQTTAMDGTTTLEATGSFDVLNCSP